MNHFEDATIITRTEEIKLKLTPQEVAKAFINSDSEFQVEFFNEVAIQVEGWGNPLYSQMQWITESEKLTNGAREIMRIIGEYASKEGVKND